MFENKNCPSDNMHFFRFLLPGISISLTESKKILLKRMEFRLNGVQLNYLTMINHHSKKKMRAKTNVATLTASSDSEIISDESDDEALVDSTVGPIDKNVAGKLQARELVLADSTVKPIVEKVAKELQLQEVLGSTPEPMDLDDDSSEIQVESRKRTASEGQAGTPPAKRTRQAVAKFKEVKAPKEGKTAKTAKAAKVLKAQKMANK